MFETIKYFNRKNILLYITSRCNYKCIHCFYAKKINVLEEGLTIGNLKRILPMFPRSRFMSITGGEPFLREDLIECIALVIQYLDPEEIEINTNGSLSENIRNFCVRYLNMFKRKKLLLQLTLFGSERVHDGITGLVGSFKKFDETVKVVGELLREYANIDAIFCVPIMRNNHKEVSFLFEYAHRNNIKIKFSPLKSVARTVRFSQKALLDFDCAVDDENLFLTRNEYIDFLRTVEIESKKFSSFLWPDKDRLRNYAYLYISAGYDIGECCFRKKTYVIFSNGDYAICELHKPVGNLLEESFLNKKRISSMIKETKHCICTHGEYIFKNLSNMKKHTEIIVVICLLLTGNAYY